MPTSDDNNTHFLAVDLDIEADDDLSPLVSAMAPGAFPLREEMTSDGYIASLELADDPQDADSAIRGFAKLIEGLSPAARAIWDRVVARDFNIGVQAGTQPHQFELNLQPATLRAAADLGARIVVTVYAPDGHQHHDPR